MSGIKSSSTHVLISEFSTSSQLELLKHSKSFHGVVPWVMSENAENRRFMAEDVGFGMHFGVGMIRREKRTEALKEWLLVVKCGKE